MRNLRISGLVTVAAVLSLLSFFMTPSGLAQAEAGRGGRGQAARPQIQIPRLADGHPNLGWSDPVHKGTWQSGTHWDYALDLVDRKQEGIPFQPWAKALYEYRVKTEHKDDPEGFCVPPGGTRATSTRSPWEFLQMPDQKRIVRIFEDVAHIWSVIYMDGRPHPQEAYDIPTWMGHSVGHWEGDTLVVDTVGFNEGHWASVMGAIRTNLHHLVEKFTRKDYYTLHYEVTIDDPGAYTRPWTIGWDLNWNEGGEMDEAICQENNRFLEHYENLKIEGAQ